MEVAVIIRPDRTVHRRLVEGAKEVRAQGNLFEWRYLLMGEGEGKS
jgi:hypothetical protein